MSTQTSISLEAHNFENPEFAAALDIAKMGVFWNWELVYTCNYRCTYCNYTALGWETHYPSNAYPGLKRLEEVWARLHGLYGPIHIEMSGGECSSYPRFYDLMTMLTRMHTLTLDTNLSFDVEKFAASLDLKRLRLATSFHPEFAALDPFLAKCLYLKERSVADVFVNYIAYPDQLKDMAAVKRRFNAEGIYCYIQPFQGVYKKGAVYPDSYTEEEKKLVEEALAGGGFDSQLSAVRFSWKGSTMRSGTDAQVRKIQEESRATGASPLEEKAAALRWSPFPWSDSVQGGRRDLEKPKREPVLCRMGQKYAKTYANGDTFRCCAQLREDMPARYFREKIYLGNLFLDDGLKLLEEPALCDYEPCPCDRCMVVGQEARWAHRWAAPQT